MTNWYDYDNQEMVSLPPVGEIVITDEAYSGDKIVKVKILEHNYDNGENFCACRKINDGQDLGYLSYFRDFRPLDWDKVSEKKKIIDEAVQIMYDNACATKGELIDGVKRLYELGYLKFPEDK